MEEYTPYTEIAETLVENIKQIRDLPCLKNKHISYYQLDELRVDLKRSISKRPLRRYWEGISHYYECPECNVELDSVEEEPYCPYCGQAINWSDGNDE